MSRNEDEDQQMLRVNCFIVVIKVKLSTTLTYWWLFDNRIVKLYTRLHKDESWWLSFDFEAGFLVDDELNTHIAQDNLILCENLCWLSLSYQHLRFRSAFMPSLLTAGDALVISVEPTKISKFQVQSNSKTRHRHSPILNEVRPHLHHPLFGVCLRRCRIEIDVENAEIEEIAKLVAVTNSGSINIQQALVQAERAIVSKSIDVRAVVWEFCVHLGGVADATHEHLISQQEDHFLDRVFADRSTAQIEIADSIGHQASLTRISALCDV